MACSGMHSVVGEPAAPETTHSCFLPFASFGQSCRTRSHGPRAGVHLPPPSRPASGAGVVPSAPASRPGMGSTDLLYYAAGTLDVPGAMFTASHNPAQYNGIKMCQAGAKPIGQESGLAQIRAEAEQFLDTGVPSAGSTGSVTQRDLLADYDPWAGVTWPVDGAGRSRAPAQE